MVSPFGASGLVGTAEIPISFKSSSGAAVSGLLVSNVTVGDSSSGLSHPEFTDPSGG